MSMLNPGIPSPTHAVSCDNTLRTVTSTNTAADTAFVYLSHIDITTTQFEHFSGSWTCIGETLMDFGIKGTTEESSITSPGTVTLTIAASVGHTEVAAGTLPSVLEGGVVMSPTIAPGSTIAATWYLRLVSMPELGGTAVQIMNTGMGYPALTTLSFVRKDAGFPAMGVRITFGVKWAAAANNHIVRCRGINASISGADGIARTIFTGSKTITAEQLGITYHRWPNSSIPSTPALDGSVFGLARSHDYSPSILGINKGTRWNNIETTDWDGLTSAQIQADPGWVALDQFVAAHANRAKIITLFGTPSFHSLRPTEEWGYGATGGGAAPPDDLAAGNLGSWARFVSAVVTRYAGQSIIYELWNEPNLADFYTGTVDELGTMCMQAIGRIRALDATAKITTPATTSLIAYGNGVSYALQLMYYGGGSIYTQSDYIALHLYQLDWCPNSILQGIKDLRAVAAGRGFATKPMLVTEGSPSLEYLTDNRTRQFKVRAMQRYMILSLFADPYIYASAIYAADNGIMGWIADDVAAWNTLRSHLVSGVVTSVVLKTNGSLLVTVGGVTKEF